jgi:hypothetical protein
MFDVRRAKAVLRIFDFTVSRENHGIIGAPLRTKLQTRM